MDRPYYYLKKSWVTISLVVINVFIFLLLEINGSTTDANYMLEHGAMNPMLVIYSHQWYRLFTSMFLHFGMAHLLNNMLLLIVLGQYLEPVLGAVRYLAVYLFSGVMGSLISMIYNLVLYQNNISAGASGAIFGVTGGLLVVVLVNKGHYRRFNLKSILFMIAISLYGGFVNVSTDNAAHVGGIFSGIILTFLIYGIKTIITLNKLKQYDLENTF